MSLTPTVRAKVRYHLGYLNVSVGNSIHLGIPSASQLGFIVENQMNDILPEAEPLLIRAVSELDCIEDQLSQARTRRLATSRTDETYLRGPEELAELEIQYDLWTRKLSDILGAPINPFSQVHNRMNGPSVVEPM